MPLLSLLLLWLAALGPAQQPKAKVEFAARAEGSVVRAVIKLRVAPNWHLYASDLGDPNAVGRPLELRFTGEGVTWGEPRYPTPDKEKQEYGQDGTPATAAVYRGTIAIYVTGALAEGADLSRVGVHLDGQTCEEGGQCIKFTADAPVTTPGPDAAFADFPADLVPASAAPEAAAQEDFEPYEDPEAKAGVELYVRAQGERVEAAVRITLEEGWHIYHEKLGPEDAVGLPTRITLGGPGIEWGAQTWPEPQRAEQEYGMDGKPTWILEHDESFVVHAEGRLKPGADVARATASVKGQTCDANGCIPFEARVRSLGRGSDALFAKPAAAAAAGGSSPAAPEPKPVQPLGTFLWLAVFWGVFSLLMPCTYPMIPITISFFTKQSAHSKSKQLTLSFLYGLGIVLMFSLIGVVAGLGFKAGGSIIGFATHPVTNLVIGTFFIVFALSLFGIFNLQPPAFLMDAAGRARSTGGYLGVFLMGATLVITSFTCTAPFVGNLLSVGAQTGEFGRIVLGMTTFGLTMALPFVALSMVPGKLKALPKSGEWMNTLKVTLGFVELAAALKFISNADLVYDWQILPREVFLMLWFGILLVAALYLLGMVRYHGESGEIGGGRLVAGMSFACFSLYCLFGALGNELDVVMTALAPPYSSRRVAGFESGGGAVAQKDHEIVIDDLEGAVAKAAEQRKLVLVNFTGHT